MSHPDGENFVECHEKENRRITVIYNETQSQKKIWSDTAALTTTTRKKGKSFKNWNQLYTLRVFDVFLWFLEELDTHQKIRITMYSKGF